MARDHFDTLIVYMKGLTQGWIIGESNYDWAEMPSNQISEEMPSDLAEMPKLSFLIQHFRERSRASLV